MMARANWISVAAFGLLLSSAAVAQNAPSTPGAREQLREAQATVSALKETLTYIEGLRAAASGDQDVERAQCVNRQASDMNALITVSEIAVSEMESAFAEGLDARAEAEARKLRFAAAKSQEIRALAESCLGEEGSADTRRTVDYDGEEDEASVTVDNDDIGTDPPGSSPFE